MAERELIDPVKLDALRQELGSNFVKVFDYFREDGAASITAIEEAARVRSAVALVRPAHTLKGDSLQFGATGLGRIAERIELAARRAVDGRDYPAEISREVARLRPLFEEIVAMISQDSSAVSSLCRAVGLGRKMSAMGRTTPL